MSRKKIYLLTFALTLVNALANAQCAMCRAVLETQDGQSAAEGVNDGIVYLMIIPYLLIGGVGYLIYRNFSKLKK